MSSALNPSQLVVNCRRIVSYNLTDLVADDRNTLKRSIFKPLFTTELHEFDARPNLPKSNATVEDIAPAVLATLSGIWANMTQAGTSQFTVFNQPLFQAVPEVTKRPYADVASVVKENPLFSQNTEIHALADKIIHASNS